MQQASRGVLFVSKNSLLLDSWADFDLFKKRS